MSEIIYKVGAIIAQRKHILVVKKDFENRPEFIVPGGKPEGSESPVESLRRELKEELDVELMSTEWYGRFHETATFEEVPLVMDMYLVTIKGVPRPNSEIHEILWIDRNYKDHGIVLGYALERQIIPELIRRDLI